MINRRTFITNISQAGALPFLAPLIDFSTQKEVNGFQKNIHVFSKHLQYLDFDEMGEVAKMIGFDGIDLTVRPGGHIEPKDAKKKLPKAVKTLKNAGLKVDMMTTNITDPNDSLTEEVLAAASKAGISTYRMGSLKYDFEKSMPENLEGFQKSFAQLAELNQKYGIKGAYQNHAGTRLGSSVWDIYEVIKDIDPKWLGIQYDIKHATAEGGRSWPLGFHLIKDRIHTIDIKDFLWKQNGGKWKDTHVPLGDGMVDWKAYWEKWKELDKSVPLSMHFEYPLGGADHGKRDLTMPKEEIYAFMKKDLLLLREMLASANL